MRDRAVQAGIQDEVARIPQPRRASAVTRGSTRTVQGAAPALLRRALRLDHRLAAALRPHALGVLRILLGLLFVWFGALKLLGASPVEGLVAGTLPWVDRDVVVPALGAVELVLGVGLLAGVLLRVVLPVLAAHLVGTFLTFVMLPTTMFRDRNPVLLTADGEFVMKNLVLVSATLVLIAHTSVARAHDTTGPGT